MCHLSVWDSLAASQEAFLVAQLPPSSPYVPCYPQTPGVARVSPSTCDILLVPAVLHNGVKMGCFWGGKEQESPQAFQNSCEWLLFEAVEEVPGDSRSCRLPGKPGEVLAS